MVTSTPPPPTNGSTDEGRVARRPEGSEVSGVRLLLPLLERTAAAEVGMRPSAWKWIRRRGSGAWMTSSSSRWSASASMVLVVLLSALAAPGVDALTNPRIVEHPESQYVAKNEPATLNCKAEGEPPPIVTWYRDGQPVITANENPSSHRMLLPSGQLFFLRIINNKNSKPDVGTYYCNATNPETRVSAVSREAKLEIAVIGNDFREQPRSVEVAVGSEALLDCRPPRGEPEPRVRWRKDSDPVRPNERVVVTESGSLRIKDARKEDSGVYVCIAYNIGGEKESNPARLAIREKPRIIEGPKDVVTQENSDVLFNCHASGEPEPTIIWKKVDDQMPQGRLQILEDRSLKIERARQMDEGVYVCRAENSVGWHEAEAKLTVHSQPSFIATPRDKVVGVGRRATFRCEVTGNPVPAVFWNKEASQTLMFPNQDHGRMSVLEDGTLVIEPVQKDDAGEYICKGLSIAGSAYAKARLDVKDIDPRPPPIIHQGPQNQTLPVNSIALMQCLATGEPAPAVRWHRNGRILQLRDPRFSLLDSGTLQISDLRKTDTGWYTCKAVSETGETSWSAALLVETPTNPSIIFHRTPEPSTFPGAPSRPTVSDITETSVRLTWRANPSHGASPVFAYTVEYFSHETGEGWIVASDGATEQSYIVRGLRPDTSYMFLVRARNSHGLSLPSHVSASIHTKGVSLANGRPTMPPLELAIVRDKLSGTGPIVQLLSVEALSSTSIKVTWDVRRNQRYIGGFHVRRRGVIADPGSEASSGEFVDVTVDGADVTVYTIDGLNPYTLYEVNVRPWYRSVVGLESNSMRVRTLEDVPSAAPANIRTKLIDNTTLYLTWEAPAPNICNGVLRGYKIYLLGNESRFSREIQVNSSLEAVYIHQIVRDMIYRIQMSAFTRVGEGVRSEAIYVGPQVIARQDVLREPWFLLTLFGSIGGLLWLVFCIFSIWLCRRRWAAAGIRKMKNTTGYTVVNQKQCDMGKLGGMYNISLAAPNYTEKDAARHDIGQTVDVGEVYGNVPDGSTKEIMYGVGNLQSTPAMKTFYNKALLNAEPYATTDLMNAQCAPSAPMVLPVTGSAFRPVQQSAYIIRPTGPGAGSSSDSCMKPDASSTSSNNETTTNNDISAVDHNGVGYDSGHPFEQCDFATSPMSEYGPLIDRGAYDCNPLNQKQPVLFLPPPPDQPPPSDIGTPPDSPTDSTYGDPRYHGRRLMHSDCERPGPHRRGPPPTNRFGTTTAAQGWAQQSNRYRDGSEGVQNIPSRMNHAHGVAQSDPEFGAMGTSAGYEPPASWVEANRVQRQMMPAYANNGEHALQSPPHSPISEVGLQDCNDLESEVDLPAMSQNGCYSPVSSVSDLEPCIIDDQAVEAQYDVIDTISESDLSSSEVASEAEEPFIGADVDFASAVAHAAQMAGLTVVGSTVTDTTKKDAARSKRPPRVRRRLARCHSPYSTDSNYEGPDTAPRRPYPKSERRKQLRQQQQQQQADVSRQPALQNTDEAKAAVNKPKPPPVAAKPQAADLATKAKPMGFQSPTSSAQSATSPRVAMATVASTRRSSDSESTSRTNPLSAFDTRDTPVV